MKRKMFGAEEFYKEVEQKDQSYKIEIGYGEDIPLIKYVVGQMDLYHWNNNFNQNQFFTLDEIKYYPINKVKYYKITKEEIQISKVKLVDKCCIYFFWIKIYV